jgi:uncharacterized protein (TIGR00297 family)
MFLSAHPLILQLLAGFILAGAISALSLRSQALASSGAVAATVVGGAVFGFGGWQAAVPLLVFFLSSTLLSKWRRRRKAELRYEKGGRRDAGQVLANGGVAAALIVIAALAPAWRAGCTVAFLAALAEANADTWATEVGSASGVVPRLITTLKTARPGMSGAVSLPGLGAALVGAALVGSTDVCMNAGAGALQVFGIVVACGFVGSLCDSVLGATVQAQYALAAGDTSEMDGPKLSERLVPGSRLARGITYIGNDAVNFLSTVAAALLGFVLQYLLQIRAF